MCVTLNRWFLRIAMRCWHGMATAGCRNFLATRRFAAVGSWDARVGKSRSRLSSSFVGGDGNVSDENNFRRALEKSIVTKSKSGIPNPMQNPKPGHTARNAKIWLKCLVNNATVYYPLFFRTVRKRRENKRVKNDVWWCLTRWQFHVNSYLLSIFAIRLLGDLNHLHPWGHRFESCNAQSHTLPGQR